LVWVIKRGSRIVGHVLDGYAVLEPGLAALIERCLAAYGVTAILGEVARTPLVYGFKVVGPSPDVIAVAVKRCIAHILHVKPAVVEEKIYAVRPKARERAREGGEDEFFEPA